MPKACRNLIEGHCLLIEHLCLLLIGVLWITLVAQVSKLKVLATIERLVGTPDTLGIHSGYTPVYEPSRKPTRNSIGMPPTKTNLP